MPYSQTADLLLGEVPLPTDPTNPQKYIQDAADEIDSKLGFRYVTPIKPESTAANRPTILLLKRINNFLASGRMICAAASKAELQEVHAYGASLIREAQLALDQLLMGDTVLPGAELVNPDDSGLSGPQINNIDVASNVESFYAFTGADPLFPYTPTIFPAGSTQRYIDGW